MKYVNIYGKKRDISKKNIRFIRISGNIPCILYGKDINVPFYTESKELNKIMRYSSGIYGVNIKIEGYDQEIKAIQKEIQFDPVSDKILHIDFCKIEESKSIILDLPVKFIGRPIGVTKGGEYSSLIRKLKIKTMPSDSPEDIKINVSHLDIGDRITVKDLLSNNDKYTILHPIETIIARVKNSRLTQKVEDNKDKEEDQKNK
ncbi:50S ribosomal protein L25 [Blattabacterium cuenoti]|uniref:50S ribosomal protein L25 n=1 Tax=Blattabacterium cuenoti TaxID=1653831 RepID=UPI00163BA59B|nr:50S ribosomal protein L25 [Blattabacterium cuenoti]